MLMRIQDLGQSRVWDTFCKVLALGLIVMVRGFGSRGLRVQSFGLWVVRGLGLGIEAFHV